MLRNVTFLHNATILHFAAWLGNTFKCKLMPDLRVPKKKNAYALRMAVACACSTQLEMQESGTNLNLRREWHAGKNFFEVSN